MNNRRTHRGGFTLIELLLSMGISAALLVAVAFAFGASNDAVAKNGVYTRCTQTARGALDLITTEARRAQAIRLTDNRNGIDVIAPSDAHGGKEAFRRFEYYEDRQMLTEQIFTREGVALPKRQIADHVTGCRFSLNTGNCLSIHLVCGESAVEVTLDDAITPAQINPT